MLRLQLIFIFTQLALHLGSLSLVGAACVSGHCNSYNRYEPVLWMIFEGVSICSLIAISSLTFFGPTEIYNKINRNMWAYHGLMSHLTLYFYLLGCHKPMLQFRYPHLILLPEGKDDHYAFIFVAAAVCQLNSILHFIAVFCPDEIKIVDLSLKKSEIKEKKEVLDSAQMETSNENSEHVQQESGSSEINSSTVNTNDVKN